MTGFEMFGYAKRKLQEREVAQGRKLDLDECADLLYDSTDWPPPTCQDIADRLFRDLGREAPK